jgi:hypothetical protein
MLMKASDTDQPTCVLPRPPTLQILPQDDRLAITDGNIDHSIWTRVTTQVLLNLYAVNIRLGVALHQRLQNVKLRRPAGVHVAPAEECNGNGANRELMNTKTRGSCCQLH